MARPRRTAAEMFPLVEQYLERSVTQTVFCAEHDVPQSVLTYWLAKYRRHTPEPVSAFIEVTPPALSDAQPLLEIVYPHGVRLRFFAPLAPAYLGELVTLQTPGI